MMQVFDSPKVRYIMVSTTRVDPAFLQHQQRRLTAAHRHFDGFHAFQDRIGFVDHPLAVVLVEHLAEQLGAPDQPHVALQQTLKRRGLVSIALRHSVGLGNRLRPNLPLQRSDRLRKPLQRLRARDSVGVGARLLARGRRKMKAPIGALGGLDLSARLPEQPSHLGANGQVVGAKLVL